jgi:hypothetical protein
MMMKAVAIFLIVMVTEVVVALLSSSLLTSSRRIITTASATHRYFNFGFRSATLRDDIDGCVEMAAVESLPHVVTTVNSATLRFNNVLSRMAKSCDAITAPRVETMLLEKMDKYIQYYEDRIIDAYYDDEDEDDDVLSTMVIPNTVSFTNAITAWARCTRKDSAKRASSLLERMLALYETRGWEHVRPNKITYNSVITAWARSGERGSATMAESLLMQMYEFYNNQTNSIDGGALLVNNNNLKPDSRSWNAVINAVARSRDPNCADRARALLDEMGRLYNEGDTDLKPDALTFGAVINSYANSGVAGASDKASQLLLHMESLNQLGYDGVRPTTFVYNACMNAFAKDPMIIVVGEDGEEPAMAAQLDRAERAEQLLDSMERRYDKNIEDVGIMPDCISYGTVINAYANANSILSGERADVVLRRMVQRYLMGNDNCKPNAVVFTAAIKAHLASMNATKLNSISSDDDDGDDDNDEEESKVLPAMQTSARRCEDLLQQLCLMYYQCNENEQRLLKPTSVTFELVTKALTQVNDKDGVERVKQLRKLITS